MQLKNRRDFTLIDILEKTFTSVPIEQRFGLAIEFSTSEKILRSHLEAIYALATQRLLHLAYYLEWSRTIGNDDKLKPKPFGDDDIDYIRASFHNFEKMTLEVSAFFNSSFASWINNQTVRELNEFLKVYLLELYETCTVLEHTKAPIKIENFVDIKRECQDFEKGGMKERLSVLRKKFDFHLTHHQEVLSLYEVRNIFSHFDGVVTKKFCNKDNILEVSWPQNTYKLKKRGQNEWVSYHKARKPFSSNVYESVRMTWLNKSETRNYKSGDQIKLSDKDLNDLIFFYLHIFNELQQRLVEIVKGRGFKVKPFTEYMVVFAGVGFVTVDES